MSCYRRLTKEKHDLALALVAQAPPNEQRGAMYEYLLCIGGVNRELIWHFAQRQADEFPLFRDTWRELRETRDYRYEAAVWFIRGIDDTFKKMGARLFDDLLGDVPKFRVKNGRMVAALKSVP